MLNRFTGYKRLIALAALSGGAAPVERTATGNPLTFETDLAKPLKSLIANFLPVQASGTPAPDNILPITGWDAVNVFHAGKNLADFVNGKGIASDGTIGDSANRTATVNPIDIKSGASYVFTFESGFDGIYSVFNGDTLVRRTGASNGQTLDTSGGNKLFVCVYKSGETATVENSSPMVRVSTAPEGYEPYISPSEYSASFPSTIFGGYVDMVTGEVWATYTFVSQKWKNFFLPTDLGDYTRKQIKISNGETKAQSSKANERFCNIASWLVDYNSQSTHYYFYNSGNEDIAFVFLPSDTDGEIDVQLCVALKSPVLITTLTPQEITALIGTDTIWSDANDSCEVTYLVSAAYADSHPVGGLGSGLLGFGSGNPDPDEPGEPDQPDEPSEPDQPADDQPEEP